MDEKDSSDVVKAEATSVAPPSLPISFAELEAIKDINDRVDMLDELSRDFKMLVGNIVAKLPPSEVGDAVSKLVAEYAIRSDGVSSKGKKWQPLTDAVATKAADMKLKATTKMEHGVEYNASDYAYVPDAEKPSTWKLRLADGETGNITIAQLGRAAAALSSGGFRGNKVKIPANAIEDVKARIRNEYRKMHVRDSDMPMSVKEHAPSFVLKEQSDGSYRWLAIYSNKFRDRDGDIISDASHRRLDKMINDGTVPYPELWYWHVPGSRWGKADFHAYDDRGFSIAAGTVDVGKEHIAKAVSERGGVLVSHGMPIRFIERDPSDEHVITKHVTVEISPLPAERAANLLTGFNILSEDNMAIAKEKKEELAGLGFNVDEIEKAIGKSVEKATADGIEFKESGGSDESGSVGEQKAGADTNDAVVAYDSITRKELSDVVSEIGAAIKAVSDAVAELHNEVMEVKEATATGDDLREIFQSAIGSKDAMVRKNSKLANDVPEAKEDTTGVSFLDKLING